MKTTILKNLIKKMTNDSEALIFGIAATKDTFGLLEKDIESEISIGYGESIEIKHTIKSITLKTILSILDTEKSKDVELKIKDNQILCIIDEQVLFTGEVEETENELLNNKIIDNTNSIDEFIQSLKWMKSNMQKENDFDSYMYLVNNTIRSINIHSYRQVDIKDSINGSLHYNKVDWLIKRVFGKNKGVYQLEQNDDELIIYSNYTISKEKISLYIKIKIDNKSLEIKDFDRTRKDIKINSNYLKTILNSHKDKITKAALVKAQITASFEDQVLNFELINKNQKLNIKAEALYEIINDIDITLYAYLIAGVLSEFDNEDIYITSLTKNTVLIQNERLITILSECK